jgi:hypothetical protein
VKYRELFDDKMRKIVQLVQILNTILTMQLRILFMIFNNYLFL